MHIARLSISSAVVALVASSLSIAAAPPPPPGGGLRAVPGVIEVADSYGRAVVEVDGRKLVSVLIDLDQESVASYEGGEPGFAATSPEATGEAFAPGSKEAKAYDKHLRDEQAAFDRDLRRSSSGAKVTGNLTWAVGGVTALVPPADVERVAGMPGVRGVYLDELQQLQTDSSPAFIGAPAAWDALGGPDRAGEGVVVGVLDTGIWPEHPSMSDPDPGGRAYPAPPSSWSTSTSRDACDFGDTAHNGADAAFSCNNKLVAAYDFTDTYKSVVGLLPSEYDSARDDNGHGTHTATTAAGNGGVTATLLGVDRGLVSGIAPRAHVAVYRVCAELGCFSSDSVAAVQQAILDGVDVINFSISGGGNPYSDIVSLAFRDAYAAGIVVNASAGNSGPGADTVAHREPWTVTVGASTSDRHFLSTVTLQASNGDTLTLTGASVTSGITAATPVVISPDPQCNPMAAGTFSGQIVMCDRGGFARVVKSHNVKQAGGGGMLLANLAPQGLATDNHPIPSVHLENLDGDALRSFITSHAAVTATFTDGTPSVVTGDVMAAFSSRGGAGQTLGISKPDVTAPGVQILAGHTPTPANAAGGSPGELFQSIQGTSMSSPHSAGVAALVTAAHPDWTAGQRKSAMMLSAQGATVLREDGATSAGPFEMGSGSLRPLPAMEVGITMDETASDYTALRSQLWDSNYPSLYVPSLAGAITVQRTITNVTAKQGKWELSVEAPADLVVDVPKHVQVAAGADGSLPITIDARSVPFGETRHATLLLREKKLGQTLRFPITVVRRAGEVTLSTTCSPTTVVVKTATDCSIEATNTAFEPATVHIEDALPKELSLVKNSIVGGREHKKTIVADAVLAAAQPPGVTAIVDGAAATFGYVPLGAFGSSVDVGATDESIANFNVPAFTYAGESYSRVGVVSNGYVVVGGGTGADVDFVNSALPDPTPPNNVLAPFWTDLNPASGGRVLINVLTDGVRTWIVMEWEAVRNYGDQAPNTFQVWIETGASAGYDAFFTYDTVSSGDGGFLTVGAENAGGTSGESVYLDGSGQAPSTTASGYAVGIGTAPGAPGGTHTVTFRAEGKKVGQWVNDALLRSDRMPGTVVARQHGEVVR